ncbi:MAG: hypothetical protein ACP5L4_02025 [Thermoplasmata archaeon]
MRRLKSGKLYRSDKKLALKDIKEVRKNAQDLARQTKRDLFKSGKMTLKQMESREKHIDTELNRLDNLLGQVNTGHEEYHRLKNAKHSLQVVKENLKLEKKRKKYEQKLKKYNRQPKKSGKRNPLISLTKKRSNEVDYEKE